MAMRAKKVHNDTTVHIGYGIGEIGTVMDWGMSPSSLFVRTYILAPSYPCQVDIVHLKIGYS